MFGILGTVGVAYDRLGGGFDTSGQLDFLRAFGNPSPMLIARKCNRRPCASLFEPIDFFIGQTAIFGIALNRKRSALDDAPNHRNRRQSIGIFEIFELALFDIIAQLRRRHDFAIIDATQYRRLQIRRRIEHDFGLDIAICPLDAIRFERYRPDFFVVFDIPIFRTDDDMRLGTGYFLAKIGFKTAHHAQNDDERHHANGNAANANQRNHA